MVEVKLKKRKNCDNELGQKTIFKSLPKVCRTKMKPGVNFSVLLSL